MQYFAGIVNVLRKTDNEYWY